MRRYIHLLYKRRYKLNRQTKLPHKVEISPKVHHVPHDFRLTEINMHKFCVRSVLKVTSTVSVLHSSFLSLPVLLLLRKCSFMNFQLILSISAHVHINITKTPQSISIKKAECCWYSFIVRRVRLYLKSGNWLIIMLLVCLYTFFWIISYSLNMHHAQN